VGVFKSPLAPLFQRGEMIEGEQEESEALS
jgi:hypothetical protein